MFTLKNYYLLIHSIDGFILIVIYLFYFLKSHYYIIYMRHLHELTEMSSSLKEYWLSQHDIEVLLRGKQKIICTKRKGKQNYFNLYHFCLTWQWQWHENLFILSLHFNSNSLKENSGGEMGYKEKKSSRFWNLSWSYCSLNLMR